MCDVPDSIAENVEEPFACHAPYNQRWALPQIGPQIRKLRTQVSICGFANLISYRKYLRICGEKLKFTANPQTNRQCCLIRGKTAWKKWMLLFSGLEVDDRELMTFFFFFFFF